MKKVVIKVKGAAFAPLEDFNWFQGELKYLPEENYQALKLSILNLGFSFAITVWFSNDGKMNIVDGHQRVLTLKAMKADGYEIPFLPYDAVEANSYDEAKKKVLAGASQYGQIQHLGLSEFISDTKISGLEISHFAMLPGIDPLNLPQVGEPNLVGVLEHTRNLASNAAEIEDDIPEPPKIPKTKLGDIYLLGSHRLMCGDSISLEQIS